MRSGLLVIVSAPPSVNLLSSTYVAIAVLRVGVASQGTMQCARMRYKRASAALVLALAGCTGSAQEPATRQVWQQRAALPEARTEVSVTTDGRLVYLAGGFGQVNGQQPSAPRTLYVYDPAADSWSSPGSIPEGMNHAGLVHLDGKL